MAKSTGRGIGDMGDIRRPPPFRFFIQLYRREVAFQAMIDFVVLGSLTIAFLKPEFLLHPFSGTSSSPPQQHAAAPSAPPSPFISPPAAPSTAQMRPANDASSASKAPPAASNTQAAPAAATPATDSSKAVANLKKLPPWAAVPVRPVNTPGLQNLPISFTNFVTGALHPATRFLTVDDRSFAELPYQLRETVKAALAARADEDGERMRTILKDANSPEGTPELLIGLSYLIHTNAETAALAEQSYRIALQKGQPQAPVLLGLLLTTGIKNLKGTAAEGKALMESVMDNDRVAWLAKGNSYLSGESGSLDPVKAAPWIIKAAEAGEPLALLQYARLAESGIGMEKNTGLAEGALRRAAELGLTEAEDTLGRWILSAYEKKFTDDPAEGIRLEEKVLTKNYINAQAVLGRLYTFNGRAPTMKDEPRGTQMLQECAQYRIASCHNNLGLAEQLGRGTDRDVIAAWAHYDVGRQLNTDFVMQGLDQLEKTMTPTEREEAHKQSKDIMTKLKNMPSVISLRRD
jgi:TPR repeat protein